MVKLIDIQYAKSNGCIRDHYKLIEKYIHSVDLRVFSNTGLRISGPYINGNRIWIEVRGKEVNISEIANCLRGMGKYLRSQGIDVDKHKIGNRLFVYREYQQLEENVEIDRLNMILKITDLLTKTDDESVAKIKEIQKIING